MLDHAHFAVNQPTCNGWQVRVEGNQDLIRLILFEKEKGIMVGQVIVEPRDGNMFVGVADNADPDNKGYLTESVLGGESKDGD